MGFLDAKERVLDVSLTDRGRHLLSQNLLNFSFYAFSDDGIDYHAALTSSLTETSGSSDAYTRRIFLTEVTQYKDSKEYKDLRNFLYTVPSRRQTLPQFTTNFDGRVDITADREYFLDKLILSAFKGSSRTYEKIVPLAVIARASVVQDTPITSLFQYALEQKIQQTRVDLTSGKNVIGQTIAPDHIVSGMTTALNIKTGASVPLLEVASTPVILQQTFQQQNVQSTTAALLAQIAIAQHQPQEKPKEEKIDVVKVESDLEVVMGLDRVKIDFVLQSSEGETEASSGFLIEIFESGSDGSIVKLVEENVVDVLGGETRKGFSDDLFFSTDLETVDIISERERLQNQQRRRQEAELERLKQELRNKGGRFI